MTSAGRASGLETPAESIGLCARRGAVAGSGPGDLSPTMRIREACRRDRRSAAADRPLLLDVLGGRPLRRRFWARVWVFLQFVWRHAPHGGSRITIATAWDVAGVLAEAKSNG